MYQDSKPIFSDKSRKELGAVGEDLVVTYLKSNNFFILAKNYQKRFGEIDVIARKNDVIAFIEVKFRTTEYFHLSEVITASKQRKIIYAAKAFILEHNMYNLVYRFDVALIIYNQGKNPNLTYIENAFTQKDY